MKEFKEIMNRIKQMDAVDPDVLSEREQLLKQVENLEIKFLEFKNKLKNSNKKNNLSQFTGKPVSQLPYIFAKSLFRRQIKLKESETNKEFIVIVSDYCFDEQSGVIVLFSEKDNSKLKGLIGKYNLSPSEYNKKAKEADFRNIFHYGDSWIFQGVVK